MNHWSSPHSPLSRQIPSHPSRLDITLHSLATFPALPCTQLDARGEDWPRRAPTPSQGAELSHRPGGPPGPSNTKPQAPRPLQRLPCLRHWAPAPQGRAWPLPRHAVLRTPGSVCWTVFGRTLETRGLCPKVQLRGCQGRGGFWFSSWIPVTARDGQAHWSPGQQ